MVRIAVDSSKDAEALAEIQPPDQGQPVGRPARELPAGEQVAPHVDKLRYNPGHLYHHEREKPWQDKVRFLADVAGRARLRDPRRGQLRLGRSRQGREHSTRTTRSRRCWQARWSIASCSIARFHAVLRVAQGFRSGQCDRRESPIREPRPDVPLHLGVTEAGMPPDGIIKTRSRSNNSSAAASATRSASRSPSPTAARRRRSSPGKDPGRHRRRPRAKRGRLRPEVRSTSSVARVARAWRTRPSSSWPSRSRI